MGSFQVVLTRVTDVEDVGDTQCFDHLGVLRVLPFA